MTHFDFGMSPYSSEQSLAHATKNTGRVCDSLIDAKLNILSAKEEGTTPQKHSGRFGGDASSSTSLGEKEGNGVMCQGLCRNKQRCARTGSRWIEGLVEFLRSVLQDERVMENVVNFLDGEVCKSHQVARRRHPARYCCGPAKERRKSNHKSNVKEIQG